MKAALALVQSELSAKSEREAARDACIRAAAQLRHERWIAGERWPSAKKLGRLTPLPALVRSSVSGSSA